MSDDNNNNELTPEAVASWLKSHPDFFEQRGDLLANLHLPHESGSAVSLVERQVSVLRDRNIEMRQRLNNLINVARDNDILFEKTRSLILEIVAAKDLDTLVGSVQNALQNDFSADVSALTLFENGSPYALSKGRVVSLHEAKASISGILSSSRAVCGTLRPQEMNFLFDEQGQQIGSAAAAPLINGNIMGVLAVGSYDPNYYRSSMGTLFINYVGEVLNMVLPRHMD